MNAAGGTAARPGVPPLVRRAIGGLATLFVFWVAAAVAFSGYFGKWGFADGNARNGIVALESGTAWRPFVYRQLVPHVVGAAVRALPPAMVMRAEAGLDSLATFSPARVFTHATAIAVPGFRLTYVVTYYLTFALMLAALFALRALGEACGLGRGRATLGALLFALVFPLLLTGGGYLYDVPELLFLALAVVVAKRGGWLGLCLVTLLATCNKESFLLFLPALWPFVRARRGRARSLGVLAPSLLAAVAINVLVKLHYRSNPGHMAEHNFVHNLAWLAHPANWFGFELNYGIVTTKGLNILHVVLVAALVASTWRRLPADVRAHARLAALVNVPAFLVFGWHDELRGLSLLDPTFVLMLGTWAGAWLAADGHAGAGDAA